MYLLFLMKMFNKVLRFSWCNFFYKSCIFFKIIMNGLTRRKITQSLCCCLDKIYWIFDARTRLNEFFKFMFQKQTTVLQFPVSTWHIKI